MSYGVVVVEAAKRSGTLITARMAGEQGREVFAVPGHPLDPRAEGTNHLLRSGATLVTSASDILEALEPIVTRRVPLLPMTGGAGLDDQSAIRVLAVPKQVAAPPVAPPLSGGDVERVFGAMGPAPVNMDELARATGLHIRTVQVAVLELTLAGRVERHGAHLVSRIDQDTT
jgi:DNA processing protein